MAEKGAAARSRLTSAHSSASASAPPRPSAPSLSTDIDAWRTTLPALDPSDSNPSPQASTPDAHSFYRQPPASAVQHYPPSSLPRPNLRSLSGNILSAARPPPSSSAALAAQYPKLQKKSVKDLAALFNAADTHANGRAISPAASSASNSTALNLSSRHAVGPSSRSRRGSDSTSQTSSRLADSRRPSLAQPQTEPLASDVSDPRGRRASQPSSTSISPATAALKDSSRPLFGEVVDERRGSNATVSSQARSGFRVPSDTHSMSTLGPFPARDRSNSEFSKTPLSPPSWYSAVAEQPASPRFDTSHNRSYSEVPASSKESGQFASLRNVLPSSSLQALEAYKAQSRLPVRSQPRSHESIDNSVASAASTMSARSTTPPMVLAARRYDPSPKQHPSNERVKAVIQAPAAKQSPPLRTSRDRKLPRKSSNDDSFVLSSPPRVRRVAQVENMDMAARRASIFKAVKEAQDQEDRTRPVVPPSPLTPSNINPHPAQMLNTALTDVAEHTAAPTSGGEQEQQYESVDQTPKVRVDDYNERQRARNEPLTSHAELEEDNYLEQVDSSSSRNVVGSRRRDISMNRNSDFSPESLSREPSFASAGGQVYTPRHILEHVMDRRRGSQALSLTRSASNRDSGMIQIMLGDTPSISKRPSREEAPQPPPSATSARFDHLRLSQARSYSPAMLSPRSAYSLERTSTGHMTMDSDAYDVLDRVIEQYEETGTISQDMLSEFAAHIRADPDLAGDGGNPEELARAALDEMIRDHGSLYSERPTPHSGRSVHGQDGSENPSPRILPLDDEQHLWARNVANRLNHSVSQSSYGRAGIAGTPPAISSPHVNSFGEAEQKPLPLPPRRQMGSMARSSRGLGSEARSREEMQASAGLSMGDDRPSLPEIMDTGGVLGFALGGGSSRTGSPLYKNPNAQLDSTVPTPEARLSVSTTGSMGAPLTRTHTRDAGFADDEPESEIDQFQEIEQEPDEEPEFLPDETETPAEEAASESEANQASNEEKRLAKRKNIIKELVDTEFSYNADMKIIEDIYMGTTTACKDLPSDDRKVLFGNIPEIVRFSEEFHDSLKRAVSSVYVRPKGDRWKKRATTDGRGSISTSNSNQTETPEGTDEERDRKTFVGQVFNHHLGRMERVYSDYMRNHDQANQRLMKLKQVHSISVWLQECQTYAADITEAWDLDSLLVKPTQRMLKYPLLLKSLLENTRRDHPDYKELESAHKEVLNVSHRINESKKRAELMEQVINNKQKKELDFRLAKAFGRRADKLRQHVGLSDAVEDPDYRVVAQKYGTYYVQLQIIMRDFQSYKAHTATYVGQFRNMLDALEEILEVGPSTNPENNSKWRRFIMTVREVIAVAWTDHDNLVQKHCIKPLEALVRMNESVQKLMAKRKKRIVEYARYKTAKERGERIDKRLTEQGEQFSALNDTLKIELPRLFQLTGGLVEATLRNFVDLQVMWQSTWKRRLAPIIEDARMPIDLDEVVRRFKSDYTFVENQAREMAVLNGFAVSSPLTFVDSRGSFAQRPSTSTASGRPDSDYLSDDKYVKPLLTPDLGSDTSSLNRRSFTMQGNSETHSMTDLTLGTNASTITNNGYFGPAATRFRSNSSIPYTGMSSEGQRMPQSARYYQNTNRSSAESSNSATQRPTSSSTYYTTAGVAMPGTGPSVRQSGIFTSALPPDTPGSTRPTSPEVENPLDKPDYRVLFVAASLFEFNIDQTRKEAGFPYLTYTPGEIFDVIGQRGELWLAKNQDDEKDHIGWIWEKHFAKVVDM